MDEATMERAKRRARFAMYDDDATGLGRVAPDSSRWPTPDDLRRYRRAVVLADRYRRAIAEGRSWRV